MRKPYLLFLFVLLLLSSNILLSQTLTQTIRGRVVDKITKQPLPFANVVLSVGGKFIGAATDINGYYRLEKVSIGRQEVKVSYIGYRVITIPVTVISARELILDIELEEAVVTTGEVTITGNLNKERPINEILKVSSRLFTVEETQKFAGTRGDPARMSMNYAGVSGANDQRNDIIIRGNSPTGILWRIDEVDVPNPNHFAALGATGGPVSILNNNMLANSDFITGAFPAEYGNALSGVFDLKMRSGNNEKREYTGQTSFNGLELGTEGPFNRKNGSSYIAHYRFSSLELADELLHANLGTSGIPKYQDFTCKLNSPGKKGNLSVFGIWGHSSIDMHGSREKHSSLYSIAGQDLSNTSDMIAGATTYTHTLSTSSFFKIIISGSHQKGTTHIDTLDKNDTLHRYYNEKFTNNILNATASATKKFSSRVSSKTGFSTDWMAFDLFSEYYPVKGNRIDKESDFSQGITLFKAYTQWNLKINERLSLTPGLHYLRFGMNNSESLEPRVSLSWVASGTQTLNAGYGLHSRQLPLYAYYYDTKLNNDEVIKTNKNLDFIRAHHFIIGSDRSLNENLRLKTEAYYQYLYNIPVEKRNSSYSLENIGAEWLFDLRDSLKNTGTSKNYGIELTLERFFNKNYYYLLTFSLFESKYKGSDGVERNTVYNGNYVANALLGGEIKLKESKRYITLLLDTKVTVAGGRRYTPIDPEASRLKNTTVYLEQEAYSKQFPVFFKADFRLGIRFGGKRISQEVQINIENITDYKNGIFRYYNRKTDKVETVHQYGIYPLLFSRIYF